MIAILGVYDDFEFKENHKLKELLITIIKSRLDKNLYIDIFKTKKTLEEKYNIEVSHQNIYNEIINISKKEGFNVISQNMTLAFSSLPF